jgi:hypothetical protein
MKKIKILKLTKLLNETHKKSETYEPEDFQRDTYEKGDYKVYLPDIDNAIKNKDLFKLEKIWHFIYNIVIGPHGKHDSKEAYDIVYRKAINSNNMAIVKKIIINAWDYPPWLKTDEDINKLNTTNDIKKYLISLLHKHNEPLLDDDESIGHGTVEDKDGQLKVINDLLNNDKITEAFRLIKNKSNLTQDQKDYIFVACCEIETTKEDQLLDIVKYIVSIGADINRDPGSVGLVGTNNALEMAELAHNFKITNFIKEYINSRIDKNAKQKYIDEYKKLIKENNLEKIQRFISKLKNENIILPRNDDLMFDAIRSNNKKIIELALTYPGGFENYDRATLKKIIKINMPLINKIDIIKRCWMNIKLEDNDDLLDLIADLNNPKIPDNDKRFMGKKWQGWDLSVDDAVKLSDILNNSNIDNEGEEWKNN